MAAAPGASFYDGEDDDEPASGSLTGKMARGLVTGGDHDRWVLAAASCPAPTLRSAPCPDTTCTFLACREVQWGYLSAHHSQNKVLEEAFARHQQAQLEQAETKARESHEVRICVDQPCAALARHMGSRWSARCRGVR